MSANNIREEYSDDHNDGAISVLPIQIVVNMYSGQEYFSISVLDNGIGMGSDAHAALFRPLKSSESRKQGLVCSMWGDYFCGGGGGGGLLLLYWF